jgi:hypothetical protein
VNDNENFGPDGNDYVDSDLDREIAMLLADPSMWEEPSAGVEQRIVTSIASERTVVAPFAPPIKRRSGWPSRFAAAAIGAAAALGVVFATRTTNDTQQADAQIKMLGTDLAPGVSGTADLEAVQSGVRIYLVLPGLPRRDGDEFYEGWLKNCDSTKLVPIGTFHELDEASGWAGVALADYPILTITREVAVGPKDPAQASSGEIVASGKLAECPAG